MDFFHWFRDAHYRRLLDRYLARWNALRPPNRITPGYLRKQIDRLLDPRRNDEALKLLEMCGAAARDELWRALDRPEFRSMESVSEHVLDRSPLEAILELLQPFFDERLIPILAPLAFDDEKDRRALAAEHLASSGLPQAAELVERLLRDAEDDVQTRAAGGLIDAANRGRLSIEMRDRAFPRLMDLAAGAHRFGDWSFGEALVRMDRDRAVASLTSPAVLSPRNTALHRVFRTLIEHKVHVPAERLLPLIESAATQLDEDSYPYEYVVGDGLILLAASEPAAAGPLVERFLEHPKDTIWQHATEALGVVHGLGTSFTDAHELVKTVPFDQLPLPVRHVLVVDVLDGEVRNGGFLQYFGNRGAGELSLVIEALERMHAPACLQIVRDVIKVFGPAGPATDQDECFKQLARAMPDDRSPFEAHDTRWYADDDRLRMRMMQYAIVHRDVFARRPT